MKTKYLFLLFAIAIASCGPSAEEKSAFEKKKIYDSLHLEENKTKLLTLINDYQDEIKRLEQSIIENEAELVVANDKMNSIKEFQFGRTETEREEQLRSQTVYILELEKKKEGLNSVLSEIKAKIPELEKQIKGIDDLKIQVSQQQLK